MQAAFASVIADAQFLRCFGKTGMRVVADGAVAHGGEHNRHGKFDLRRQLTFEPSFFIPPDTVRLLSQEHSGFHGFAQRVNGRVRYLRRVDQNSVPINRITLRVSHGGQEDTSAPGLFIDLFDRVLVPVGIFPEGAFVLCDLQRVRGAKAYTSLAIHAFALIAGHALFPTIKGVNTVCALLFTDAAGCASVIIANDLKLRINIVDTH